jgi:copper chaperone CopZ
VSTLEYAVAGMSCDHCKAAVTEELLAIGSVASVDVDLDTKRIVVRGQDLDDAAILAAIDEAGYDA